MQIIAQFFAFDTGIIKLKIEFNNCSPPLNNEHFINLRLKQAKKRPTHVGLFLLLNYLLVNAKPPDKLKTRL